MLSSTIPYKKKTIFNGTCINFNFFLCVVKSHYFEFNGAKKKLSKISKGLRLKYREKMKFGLSTHFPNLRCLIPI